MDTKNGTTIGTKHASILSSNSSSSTIVTPTPTITATARKRSSIFSTTTAALFRCKRQSRRCIRLYITIIAVVLCLYQFYLVSILYFHYPTVMDIRLDQSPYIHLPSVTICSEVSQTILFDELLRAHPSLYPLLGRKTRTELILLLKRSPSIRAQVLQILHTFPIDVQHRLTVNSSEFFLQCHLPIAMTTNGGDNTNFNHNLYPNSIAAQYLPTKVATSTQLINCAQFAPIVEKLSFEYKCFSLFLNRSIADSLSVDDDGGGGGGGNYPHLSSSSKRQTYAIHRNVVQQFKQLVWIQLNRQYIENGFLYIHPPDESHEFASSRNVIYLEANKYSITNVAFEREIIHLLPPPYDTQCHDYRMDGYESREHCLAQCKIRQYEQTDGGWPGDVYAEMNVTKNFSPLWINTDGKGGWSNNNAGHLVEGLQAEHWKNCAKQCGELDNCVKIQYDVRRVGVTERYDSVNGVGGGFTLNSQFSNAFVIGIEPPREVQMVIRHEPKYNWIEFLIYAGGLFNLYLGFTFITVTASTLRYITCSTECQTKHCCLPIFGRSKRGRKFLYQHLNRVERLKKSLPKSKFKSNSNLKQLKKTINNDDDKKSENSRQHYRTSIIIDTVDSGVQSKL